MSSPYSSVDYIHILRTYNLQMKCTTLAYVYMKLQALYLVFFLYKVGFCVRHMKSLNIFNLFFDVVYKFEWCGLLLFYLLIISFKKTLLLVISCSCKRIYFQLELKRKASVHKMNILFFVDLSSLFNAMQSICLRKNEGFSSRVCINLKINDTLKK